jgi:hypothetical protein
MAGFLWKLGRDATTWCKKHAETPCSSRIWWIQKFLKCGSQNEVFNMLIYYDI